MREMCKGVVTFATRRASPPLNQFSHLKFLRCGGRRMESIVIPNQTHTLACLLRHHLFANGASFAACTVPHPLDEDLTITLAHADSCKECLLAALRDARSDVEKCITAINAYKSHLASSMDVEDA